MCTGLIWQFLFWLIEDLAAAQGCDTYVWIKTLEGSVEKNKKTRAGYGPRAAQFWFLVHRSRDGRSVSAGRIPVLLLLGLDPEENRSRERHVAHPLGHRRQIHFVFGDKEPVVVPAHRTVKRAHLRPVLCGHGVVRQHSLAGGNGDHRAGERQLFSYTHAQFKKGRSFFRLRMRIVPELVHNCTANKANDLHTRAGRLSLTIIDYLLFKIIKHWFFD